MRRRLCDIVQTSAKVIRSHGLPGCGDPITAGAGANETAERESLRVIFFLLALAYCAARYGDENRSECASNLMGKQPASIGSDQHVAAVEETEAAVSRRQQREDGRKRTRAR